MLFRSDRKSTRLKSSHTLISYAVFCLKKKKKKTHGCTKPVDKRNEKTRCGGNRRATLRPSVQHRATRLAAAYPRFFVLFFFFNDTATTEIYTLSLHDALPIYRKSTRLNSSHTLISYALP